MKCLPRASRSSLTGFDIKQFSMATILLFGAGGQLGREISSRAARFALSIRALTRAQLNITDSFAVEAAIRACAPSVVINAAAYTDVDAAESQPEKAFSVNGRGLHVIGSACSAQEIPIIHISSDYVFDGSRQCSYDECAPVAPLNVYGRSKAAGEELLRISNKQHIILRTSWLYGTHGNSFLQKIVSLLEKRDEICVVSDQIGCPTNTIDVADAILKLSLVLQKKTRIWGTFHFAGPTSISRYGFACQIANILEQYNGRRVAVLPVTSAEFSAPALRPHNSTLDCSRFYDTFGFRAEPLEKRLKQTIAHLFSGDKLI